MTSQADFVQPPRIAVWLVNLFTPAEAAESVLGDLLEEFSHFASKSGTVGARRWYWRQTLKTVVHLFGTGFRAAPWSTTLAVVGGFLLLKLVSGLPDKVLSAVTVRYLFYWKAHFKTYMFFATDGMLTVHLVLSMLVGCMVALVAKGREMVAAMTLGLVHYALAGVAWWATEMAVRPGGVSFPLLLAVLFADSFAIFVGGAIVRARRSAATMRPSGV
ncbi:MAG: permease prefix domain 2-containing transporter [Candidatus Sulfotelmatobacter sp.]